MRKVSTTIYLTVAQLEELNKLTSVTKVSRAEYIRQAVDLVIANAPRLAKVKT